MLLSNLQYKFINKWKILFSIIIFFILKNKYYSYSNMDIFKEIFQYEIDEYYSNKIKPSNIFNFEISFIPKIFSDSIKKYGWLKFIRYKYFILENSSYWPTFLYEYSYWIFCTGISLLNIYTRKFVLAECFVLEYFLLNILYQKVLPEYFVLQVPYWLNILFWNSSCSCIICTGISLLTV